LVAKPLRPYVEEEISYEIFNLNTNRSIEPADGITNDADALIRLDDYIEHGPHRLQRGQARNMFGIRRVGDSEPILATPFRATIGEPQPAGSVGRAATSPTGQWKIIDGLGRQLSVFRPHANTRAAANELAAVWATENDFDGNYQVEPADGQTATRDPVRTRLDRPFVWKVIGASSSPYQSQGIEVVAASEFEAMQKARQQWNLNVGGRTEEEFFSTNGWTATPVRPAQAQQTNQPVLTPYKILNSGSTVMGFHARTESEALDKFNDYLATHTLGRYKLINAVTGQEVSAHALGSTTDLQQQRQTPGTFTGAWQVLDTDTGEELYRFSGVGNVQSDANRVAADWLRRNAPEDADMTQIEVVPIMS
jgi:hypothetical protein